jgi:predicted RecB family nuclease
MATKLTWDIIESYLNCKSKGHLKLAGASGTPSDYEALTSAAKASSREQALTRLAARFGEGAAGRGDVVTAVLLSQGAPFLFDASLEDDGLSLRFDALKRMDGASKLGNHHYLPVLHICGDKVDRREKTLLALGGLALARVQGLQPTVGLVSHGPGGRLSKVKLDAKLYRQAGQVLDEVKRLQQGGQPPRLVLNKHCQVCEFRRRCHEEAVKADDISLLAGVGEKELRRYNRKGIFTLTQLACTFRPRRTKQRAAKKHDRSLQALAVRQNTVYVAQKPEFPDRKVRLYLDVEGLPDNGFYYLIGLDIVEGESRYRLSFWADGEADEAGIWAAFLEAIKPLGDFVLLHYGAYEGRFLKEMEARHGGAPGLLARLKASSVNVLSLIYARVYFPVCSNDLKSVAGCLGFRWSAEEASGLQAIAWRTGWEASHDGRLKQQLLTYNEEDRDALERVTEMLRALGGEQGRQGDTGPAVAGVEDIPGQPSHKFCTQTFALPEFARITKCSYFDHQRDKVLCRTNPAVKKIGRRRQPPKSRAVRVNREVECDVPPAVCPHCGHDDFGVMSRYQKLVIDLKPFRGGIKSWVTRYKVERQRCKKCRKGMYPDDYNSLPYRYGWGLCSWQIYAMIALRQSLDASAETLDDLFGCSLSLGALVNLRRQAVEHYRPTYEALLATLRNGELIHADETRARIRGPGRDGYVWVFANPTTVVYVFSPTRDSDTVRKTLADFKGVLVSDFYAAYDGIDCPQQKCLIHLVRDFNDDLLKNPFDEELKRQAARFAGLLQAVVATVDRFGLKKFHLHKHKKDVESFFEAESQEVYQSEVASHYQQRLLRNRGRMFTFLDYDGVPWSNNNGEHAVKAYASRRKGMGKVFAEGGLQDYLLLLSIYQTLRYRNVSFWRFLQSGETDIEAFCSRGPGR